LNRNLERTAVTSTWKWHRRQKFTAVSEHTYIGAWGWTVPAGCSETNVRDMCLSRSDDREKQRVCRL